MPTYEYFCAANGRTVEVSHRMAEQLQNWGEVCSRAGVRPGRTGAAAPVRRLISGAAVLTGQRRELAPADCAAGPACCGGGCGLQN
jgi:predicted nucleic acid-binding Zn ribbon protein